MTTMFLATTGGHLEELAELASRVPADGPELWVTHADTQSRSLLRTQDVEFVPYVGVRKPADVIRCLPDAHRLWRTHGIRRVLSTGSGIALGYLPYLAQRGVSCHYVESAARVTAPSLTGRVLQRVPRVHRYSQYAGWRAHGWGYAGSVLDSYAPRRRNSPREGPLRVVVTVGTAREFPFPRLVEPLARLLGEDGELRRRTGREIDVLWQTGCTRTDGLAIRPRPYVPAGELVAAMARADLVVSHAGAGTALTALRAGVRPLVATRRAELSEIGDDHQAELAAELARRDLASIVTPEQMTVDDLLAGIDRGITRVGDPPALELTP